jgi:hypothetical protein
MDHYEGQLVQTPILASATATFSVSVNFETLQLDDDMSQVVALSDEVAVVHQPRDENEIAVNLLQVSGSAEYRSFHE